MKKLLMKTIMLATLIPLTVSGQQTADTVLSLKECILLSFGNNLRLQQACLERDKSRYQLKEALSAGLPQVSGFASFDDYFDIPVSMVSGDIFGQPGVMLPVQLGTKYNTTAGIQAGQMIYDASWFASVRLFKKALEISNLTLEQNKEELAYSIAQIYMFIQTTGRQLALLDSNIVAFRRIYDYSELHYNNGFILRADLDRITVVINNLSTERDNLLLARDQQINMLRYLTGIEPDYNITFSDEPEIMILSVPPAGVITGSPAEMQILEQKKELAEMNIKLAQAGFIPSLSGYAVYSRQSPVEQISDMNNKDNWYKTSFVGIKLTVPVFAGNRIRNKVMQGRIELEQVKTCQQDLQSELNIKLDNAIKKYNTNMLSESRLKVNMDLAGTVSDVSAEQYRQGIKSFTDVLNARMEYNASHLAWLNAVLQIRLSGLEIIRTNGTINTLFL